MNLLTQLLMQPPPEPAPEPQKGVPRSVSVFRPLMLGRAPMTSAELSALIGKSKEAVTATLRDTLIPRGLVARLDCREGKQRSYKYEWVGK